MNFSKLVAATTLALSSPVMACSDGPVEMTALDSVTPVLAPMETVDSEDRYREAYDTIDILEEIQRSPEELTSRAE